MGLMTGFHFLCNFHLIFEIDFCQEVSLIAFFNCLNYFFVHSHSNNEIYEFLKNFLLFVDIISIVGNIFSIPFCSQRQTILSKRTRQQTQRIPMMVHLVVSRHSKLAAPLFIPFPPSAINPLSSLLAFILQHTNADSSQDLKSY